MVDCFTNYNMPPYQLVESIGIFYIYRRMNMLLFVLAFHELLPSLRGHHIYSCPAAVIGRFPLRWAPALLSGRVPGKGR